MINKNNQQPNMARYTEREATEDRGSSDSPPAKSFLMNSQAVSTQKKLLTSLTQRERRQLESQLKIDDRMKSLKNGFKMSTGHDLNSILNLTYFMHMDRITMANTLTYLRETVVLLEGGLEIAEALQSTRDEIRKVQETIDASKHKTNVLHDFMGFGQSSFQAVAPAQPPAPAFYPPPSFQAVAPAQPYHQAVAEAQKKIAALQLSDDASSVELLEAAGKFETKRRKKDGDAETKREKKKKAGDVREATV